MKIKGLAVVLAVLLMASLMTSTATFANASTVRFAGGSGTAADPYKVATAEQLNNVRNHLDAHFVQTQNIDLSGYSNWTPIGDSAHPFTGTYNGVGRKISNLTISEAGNRGSQQRGLFCRTSNTATLENIYLENVSIGTWYVAGSLVAQNFGTIRYCKIVSGSIAGNEQIGGMAGINHGQITGCYSHVSVSADLATAGGLVGWNLIGPIESCYATGDVTGQQWLGGLVGELSEGTINASFASGNVSASKEAGGLVGLVSGGQNRIVSNCFATGNVDLTVDGDSGGGLIGVLWGKALNCYSTGAVTGGSSKIGGLVGRYFSGGTAVNCYYDTETSGRSDTGRGIPKTTAEMMAGAPAAGIFTGWDTGIWSFTPDNQYPLLSPLKGDIKINFLPPEVVDNNPLWSANGGITWLAHNDVYPVPAGFHTIIFKELTGWKKPQDLTVEVFANAGTWPYVSYSRKSYIIAVNPVPAEGGTVTGGGSYLYDSQVTLTATPAPGYRFIEWGTAKMPISTDNPYSFKATGNRILWARFAPADASQCTIAATASPAAGGIVAGAGAFTVGDSVTLTATPNSGYSFINWTENGVPVPNAASSYTFTASSDRILVANFSSANILRIAGTNRYSTAVEISKLGWPGGSDAAILARGDNYADALAGVPLAYQLDAPILLTSSSQLSAASMEEIVRLGASSVIILGGTSAVSVSVEGELQALGLTVQRIAGNSRYETACLIARELAQGGSYNTAFIAVGTNFADALSASAYAARAGCPILLTQQATLPDYTKNLIRDMGITKTWVIGGTGVISGTVFAQLPGAQRIAGNNRYSTGIALAEEFMPASTKVACLATGLNFPDAIAGGVLAAKKDTGVILVQGNLSVPNQVVLDFMSGQLIDTIQLFGGTNVINPAMQIWLGQWLGEN
ncbi:MAG: cell wall-binding repeat-containing protein [Eubacteriales bacterium]|nr:cell wall-binding repeat-containing protein [Eubacteriales bacterium]MDD3073262.1 cell wall-binding repeat-containing protein [Eubacteriales bacterium]MDD4078206.1 cell wall-binding repeat-containing protein [Eubacteriales bacterium]